MHRALKMLALLLTRLSSSRGFSPCGLMKCYTWSSRWWRLLRTWPRSKIYTVGYQMQMGQSLCLEDSMRSSELKCCYRKLNEPWVKRHWHDVCCVAHPRSGNKHRGLMWCLHFEIPSPTHCHQFAQDWHLDFADQSHYSACTSHCWDVVFYSLTQRHSHPMPVGLYQWGCHPRLSLQLQKLKLGQTLAAWSKPDQTPTDRLLLQCQSLPTCFRDSGLTNANKLKMNS